ncbi:MAG: PQQ-binding-like beta-propeller repeat protein, partial [Actinomycetota bacterium]
GFVRAGEVGVLVAWDERCGTGGATCRPVWVSANDHASRTQPLVVAGRSIYSASVRGGHIRGYTTSCEGIGTSCGPTWTTTAEPYAPTIEGGLIFAGSKQGIVYAFSTACEATCQPVWTSGPLGAQVSSPAVDGSTIFVDANDGTLRAFSTDSRLASKRHSATSPYVVLAVLVGALVIGWFVLRRRRRGLSMSAE